MNQEKKEKDNVTLLELQKLGETSEKLAREIRMISRAFKKLSHGGLSKETVVLLVHDLSGVGKPNVRSILSALESLDAVYTVDEKP